MIAEITGTITVGISLLIPSDILETFSQEEIEKLKKGDLEFLYEKGYGDDLFIIMADNYRNERRMLLTPDSNWQFDDKILTAQLLNCEIQNG